MNRHRYHAPTILVCAIITSLMVGTIIGIAWIIYGT